MKFLVRLGIFILVLVAVYCGVLWKTGQDIEKRLPMVSQKIEALYPYFKVVNRTYEKGIFSSKETISWAFMMPGDSEGQTEEIRIPLFKTETIVKHGPFPGFCLALATTETRFLAHDPSIQQILNQVWKGKAPLLVSSTIPIFSPSVKVNVNSPELKLEIGAGEGFNWEGMNIDVLVNKKFADYSYEAKMPGFVVESRSEHLSFSGFEARGSGKRAFDEFPYFFVGKEDGGIATIRVDTRMYGAAFDLVDFRYDADAGLTNDLLGVNFKAKAAVLNALNLGLENLNLDLAFDGIDAKALAQVQSDLMFLEKPETDDFVNEYIQKIFAVFKESSTMMLRNFSGSNQGGNIRMNGSFDLGSLGAFAQIAVAAQMAGEAEEAVWNAALATLSGDLFVEASRESLLILAVEIFENDFGNAEGAQIFTESMLDRFVENALVEAKDGILKTKVVVKDGIVTMNDVAVNSATFNRLLGMVEAEVSEEEMME